MQINEEKEIILRYIFDSTQDQVQKEVAEMVRLQTVNYYMINEMFAVLRKKVIAKIYDLEKFEEEAEKPVVIESLFPTEKN
jgi:uncharacterized protein YajQ (UPF0234 family)